MRHWKIFLLIGLLTVNFTLANSVNDIPLAFGTQNETPSTTNTTSNSENKEESTNAPIFYTGDIFDSKEGNLESRYSIKNVRDQLLPRVATWIGSTVGAIAVLFMIWAGIQFLTAEGDPEKITKASKTAFFVVAGLVLMTFAYAIVYLFLTVFTPAPAVPTPTTNSSTPNTTAPSTSTNK